MDSNPSALLTMITIDLHQHSPHHRELDRVLVDLVPLGRPKRMSSSSDWTATFFPESISGVFLSSDLLKHRRELSPITYEVNICINWIMIVYMYDYTNRIEY